MELEVGISLTNFLHRLPIDTEMCEPFECMRLANQEKERIFFQSEEGTERDRHWR